MNDISTCLITGLPISAYKKCEDNTHGNKSYLEYQVTINNKVYEFAFCISCLQNQPDLIEGNRSLLYGLLLNGKEFSYDGNNKNIGGPDLIHADNLKNFIKSHHYFSTPGEKLDNLFLTLSEKSKYAGEYVEIECEEESFYLKHYFKNAHELKFYLETLKEDKLIDLNYNDQVIPKGKTVVKLTYRGLLKSTQMREEGSHSKRCFVAMSFDSEEHSIFDEAIAPACENFGFTAVRVDKIHPENEQTINDSIIAEIKKSKFLICDFTKQKNGVYFEAGYGLGRGKKVIYTCREDHFGNLHFDLNHFPVLIYRTNAELLEMLKNKIEAFILD